MTDLIIDKYVTTKYVEYAKFVNMFRQIPDARDGFKVVQRRIFATLIQQGHHGDIIPCSAIIGDCIKYFHPHGNEALYGAIATLVNDSPSYLDKQGQFGSGGLDPEDPAAYRYTAVGLSNLAIETIVKLYNYSETYENENSYQEPISIPSTLPYCIVQGAIGIGNGVATHIPAFHLDDLKKVARGILSGQKKIEYIKPKPGGGLGHLDITDDYLESLHTKGKCKVVVSPDFRWDISSNQKILIIENVPTEVNLHKLLIAFKSEISEGLIFVRNESAGQDRVVIGRNKKIRRISDEEIETRARRCLCRSITYKCIVAHNGMPRLLSPYRIMEIALDQAVKANVRWIEHRLSQLEEFILFEKVKARLAQLLLKRESPEHIRRYLSLSQDQYKRFVAKALSTLRGEERETESAYNEIETLNRWKRNPNKAYMEKFL